jgi:protein Tex
VHQLAEQNLVAIIAKELSLPASSVIATADLLDGGNTVPFIARYRKEVTGNLDEVQIRDVQSRLEYLRKLGERRAAVKEEITSQGKLTGELGAQLDAAATLQALEDLYRPYKPKRQTRAAVARERGLQALADLLLSQDAKVDLVAAASQFIGEHVPDTSAALAGARDIIAEAVSDDPDTRLLARQRFAADGFVASKRASETADESGRYRVYYDFRCALRAVQPHQWLALQRGAVDGSLKIEIATPDPDIAAQIVRRWTKTPGGGASEQLRLAIENGYDRLLRPSVEREVSGQLGEYADEHAIQVFAANLRNLLLQPPLRERVVMGIDPGFRTGCKVATVSATGRLLKTATIYPHPPQNDSDKAGRVIAGLVEADGVSVIAIGNGTASRETEALLANLIQSAPPKSTLSKAAYIMVSEAGASVYSASDVARAEFPDLDVSMRGAISIARRLQDPLAELVKIDPKSIGVGLYQHDVDQGKLGGALDTVVETVVNHVGVDVNTASPQLLSYVSGISKRLAAAIVAHRDENGSFELRADLKKVKGLGPKAFEQAAGFLRVPGSRNPLDNTTIHPESYAATKALLEMAGLNLKMKDLPNSLRRWLATEGLSLEEPGEKWSTVAELLNVGEPTLRDIVDALLRPGRDPRDDLPPVVLRRDILSIDDLREGMTLKGTVRNVVDFGAFVDIGVKHDGLIHVSKMGKKYVRNPQDVVGVGDIVDVMVVSIDRERGRIGLALSAGEGA